ncbi:MAG: DUF2306 domain-containing protein [Alphaproteobacteria bacterium]|nr:DUF2306 domain-containing protein [Alphaproteobacteria bacterium]
MTVLQAPPGAPLWMTVGADMLLLLHVTGGSVAMAAGAVALVTRKGQNVHRIAGTVFFLAMLVMAGVGATVAPFLDDGQRPNTVAGVMTFYLVLTAWTTVQRPDGEVGRFAILGFAVAAGAALAGFLFAMEAQASPTGTIDNSPPQAFYIFMLIGGIAAITDLKVILMGGISGAPRIARHLWRMCTGLFIATGSFFLGQQQMLPSFMRGSLQFVPVLAPILFMIYWLIRVRLTNWATQEESPREAIALAKGE